jgi:uncharacterized protein involved in type VI secretion and phage assembly
MACALVQSAAQADMPTEDKRIYGVAVAQVIDNIDLERQGRVQLSYPWFPGIEPWARVATVSAGDERGTYFIPQTGDEVLVAFNHGDIREPFVIGSLWNGADRPPASDFTSPVTKRIIRTPRSHQIVFDDEAQSITINTQIGHKIVIGPSKIEITTHRNQAAIVLDNEGKVSIRAESRLELKAESILIEGSEVSVKCDALAEIDGGGLCEIKAALVTIN